MLYRDIIDTNQWLIFDTLLVLSDQIRDSFTFEQISFENTICVIKQIDV